jgi:phosphoribosyl 1,2-cyclic phosphodiesterase
MKIKFLYSSSAGNSTIIESGDTIVMLDAGVSYKKVKEAFGDDPKLDAIFISHEHGDHVNSAGIIARKTNAPVYIPEKSYAVREKLFEKCAVSFIEGGDSVEVGNLKVTAFSTRHDSQASNGYIFTELDTLKKFAFLTDTGGITKLMRDSLAGCNAYFIESDYDEEELEKCAEYDDFLKERIRSPYGHLSNQQALEYVNTYLDFDAIDFIAFGHLSSNTNSPEIMQKRIEYKIPKKHWSKLKIVTTTETYEV